VTTISGIGEGTIFNLFLASSSSFSYFLNDGVLFLCWLIIELYLFLTQCSVLLNFLARLAHFLPSFSTLSSKLIYCSRVHSPLHIRWITFLYLDLDDSAIAIYIVWKYEKISLLTTKKAYEQFSSKKLKLLPVFLLTIAKYQHSFARWFYLIHHEPAFWSINFLMEANSYLWNTFKAKIGDFRTSKNFRICARIFKTICSILHHSW